METVATTPTAIVRPRDRLSGQKEAGLPPLGGEDHVTLFRSRLLAVEVLASVLAFQDAG
jgi:hypothetical protein